MSFLSGLLICKDLCLNILECKIQNLFLFFLKDLIVVVNFNFAILVSHCSFLLAGLLSVRCAPGSEGTKACKETKAKRRNQTKPNKNQNTNKKNPTHPRTDSGVALWTMHQGKHGHRPFCHKEMGSQSPHALLDQIRTRSYAGAHRRVVFQKVLLPRDAWCSK